jgi:dihydroneopterin aldolase
MEQPPQLTRRRSNPGRQGILRLGDGRSWKLIETLAVEIAGMLLKDFDARAAAVTVKKFILPEARYISVRTIRRSADGSAT